MAQEGDLFAGTALDGALERRRAYARVFDPPSQRLLSATGLTTRWRCLEADAGEGAGELAGWLREQVGPEGEVVVPPPSTGPGGGVGPRRRTVSLLATLPSRGSFDLIHARSVLIHTAQFADTLWALVQSVRIGCWLVIEEPDFSAARAFTGSFDQRQAFTNVNRAREALFRAERRDFGFGARLPGLLQAQGLQDLQLENDTPMVRGGSALAALVAGQVVAQAEAYRGTGLVSAQDLDHYLSFAADPACWSIPHATIRGAGRRRPRV